MALYRAHADGLLPVRRAGVAPGHYEPEIHELAWRDLRVFTGEPLLPLRLAAPTARGVAGILALTRHGELVLVEANRRLDRDALARCLELAGWARDTSLDELAGLYPAGAAAFWAAWRAFTAGQTPVRLQRNPFLVLICEDEDAGARSTLGFLRDSGVPVTVVRATVYEAADGIRYLEVEGGAEPAAAGDDPVGDGPAGHAPAGATPAGEAPAEATPAGDPAPRDGRRVGLLDLIAAGLLAVGAELVWARPRLGQEYRARITADGQIALPDGRQFSTPSAAAMAAAGMASYDGWHAWRVGSAQGPVLDELRRGMAGAAAG